MKTTVRTSLRTTLIAAVAAFGPMACGGADGWEGSESYELGELEQELSMASGLSATTAPNQLVLGTKLPNGPAYVRIPTVTTATAPHS